MSFYVLSSGRSLAGLPVVSGMEKNPCFSGCPGSIGTYKSDKDGEAWWGLSRTSNRYFNYEEN